MSRNLISKIVEYCTLTSLLIRVANVVLMPKYTPTNPSVLALASAAPFVRNSRAKSSVILTFDYHENKIKNDLNIDLKEYIMLCKFTSIGGRSSNVESLALRNTFAPLLTESLNASSRPKT
jgi:hypothetical protein